ncbi:MAG TPA: HDIG domain-containing protein, partial [Deltaproteobacteria bacterium]|nr:HDIG domain-containing protein [Deltaproteobacteria bacterium]
REVGVAGIPREMLQLLGELKFRTSYGQNVLMHSTEMAHLSGMIAEEIGADVRTVKIATLLHDVGVKHPVDPREEILASMACHKSLRSGRRLTVPEITSLLERLDQAGAPTTCPHGRPIYKEITLEEIARWIGRRP